MIYEDSRVVRVPQDLVLFTVGSASDLSRLKLPRVTIKEGGCGFQVMFGRYLLAEVNEKDRVLCVYPEVRNRATLDIINHLMHFLGTQTEMFIQGDEWYMKVYNKGRKC